MAFLGLLLVAVLSTAVVDASVRTVAFLPFVGASPPAPAGCFTCAYDALNCSDFPTQASAQACFQYCLTVTGIDIHRLDGDNDGRACEHLPLLTGG